MARLLLIASLVGARGAAGLGAAPADSSMIQFGTAVDKSNTSQQTTAYELRTDLTCPAGYSNLVTETECEAAQIALGLPGYNGLHFQYDSQRRPYCWVGPSNGVNFNPKGDYGAKSGNANLHVLCEVIEVALT
ncbi:unnamed protein product [Prorocentrum cordatum]|uniref:Uncharacterized protein n=1 Tax=Prorocentrum cordatum TaxID=2364126 RepID=A0ABN9SHL4_9DINO|nr:unnamed protein product [Polarella glacialis]